MSILIPNRDMPKDCQHCELNNEARCEIAPNYNYRDWESFLVADGKRRDDCPLIEIPPNRMTNADRIRAMTDEELAEFLTSPRSVCPKYDCETCHNDNPCEECICEWLKKEIKDECNN